MLLQFAIKDSDGDFLRQTKTEVNIELTSVFNQYGEHSDEYSICVENMKRLICIAEPISIFCTSKEALDNICSTLVKLNTKGILTPLTLTDNEFIDKAHGIAVNKRYSGIHKVPTDTLGISGDMFSIIHNKAFNVTVKNEYNHSSNKQVKFEPITIEGNQKVYISKGGVVTTDYILHCIIRPEIVSREYFVVRDAVNLPVSRITSKGISIFTVDSREPKLKALHEFYEVPFYQDDSIKGLYNIRNYEKISK